MYLTELTTITTTTTRPKGLTTEQSNFQMHTFVIVMSAISLLYMFFEGMRMLRKHCRNRMMGNATIVENAVELMSKYDGIIITIGQRTLSLPWQMIVVLFVVLLILEIVFFCRSHACPVGIQFVTAAQRRERDYDRYFAEMGRMYCALNGQADKILHKADTAPDFALDRRPLEVAIPPANPLSAGQPGMHRVRAVGRLV